MNNHVTLHLSVGAGYRTNWDGPYRQDYGGSAGGSSNASFGHNFGTGSSRPYCEADGVHGGFSAGSHNYSPRAAALYEVLRLASELGVP